MEQQKCLHNHCGQCEDVIRKISADTSFEKVSMTFQLISDATRLKILWFLCHSEVCVNDIAIAVNMSAPAVSHHLRLLKQSELIICHREGKEMYYKLSDTPEAELVHKAIDDILDIKCPKTHPMSD